MNDDPVPMLMKRHFEYGLTHCVKSVHDVDLQRYEDFKAKYDPNFSLIKKEVLVLIKSNGLMIIKEEISKAMMMIWIYILKR